MTRTKMLQIFPTSALRDFAARPIEGGKGVFYSVDFLRGLSALAILVFHFNHFFEGAGGLEIPFSRLRENPAIDLLWPIYTHGAKAVMLFWTISGFVFMHVYAGLAENTSAAAYSVNRFARLYPLHFATLIAVAALQFSSMKMFGGYQIYDDNDTYHFILQLFFISGWGLQDGASFNNPIWSVSVEILIYAAFFVYLKTTRINFLTLLLTTSGFLILAMISKSLIAICGVYFFAGAIAYGLWREGDKYNAKGAFFISLAGVALSALFIWIVDSYEIPAPLTLMLTPLFVFSILTFAFCETAYKQINFRSIRALGDITYSTYLMHSPLQMAFLILAGLGLFDISIVFSAWFFIAYIVFVCVVSWVVFKYFERPAQSFLRRRLIQKQRRQSAAAAE